MVCLKFTKTLYFLSYACRRTKKEEEKKMNKIEIFKLGFFKLVKISETFGVAKALEYKREVALSFLSSSAWFF